MKTYEYQVLRYLPDQFGGEFVNVGLVLFQPEDRFLAVRCLRSVGRVATFFPGLDGKNLQRRLRYIEDQLTNFSNRLDLDRQVRLESPRSIQAITSSYLVKDDTALQFSEVRKGIDDTMSDVFNDLYESLVSNYVPASNEDLRTDEDVWRKLYRPLFEKRNITTRLQTHQVRTANDTIKFPYAWKNEIWHCYEPVTFDLKKADSIKNKVYRWVGRLDELSSSDEPITLQLLAALPPDDPELIAFVMEKLDKKTFGKAEVSVVRQQEADQFARKVQEEIIEHDQQ